jgi:hypothetical protein
MAIAVHNLVEQFKREATTVGAVVYEAKDAVDANNYVLQLARLHNVRHVVKSNSMLSKETELRQHLEDEGIEVKETNLGEWILQLNEEKPSGMVGSGHSKPLSIWLSFYPKLRVTNCNLSLRSYWTQPAKRSGIHTSTPTWASQRLTSP